MKFLYSIFTLLLFTLPLSAQQSEISWKTRVEHTGGNNYNVIFQADIMPGWHMYDLGPYEDGPNETVFTFEPSAGIKLSGDITPEVKAVRKFDEIFSMDIGYYEGRAVFIQKVVLTGERASLKANIEWMLCNDTSCLPPTDEDFNIEIVAVADKIDIDNIAPVGGGISEGSTPGSDVEIAAENEQDSAMLSYPDVPLSSETNETFLANADAGNESLWSLILAAMGWALLALLTPCVFPMIPMTVSFFLKNGDSVSKGRFQALMYGMFIVALYTIPIAALILITRIVGGETVTADIFNWLSTHWLPNVIFFLVFMIFAASFFGAFEITLPSRFVNKSDQKSERGGLGGVFFMALTLVLISFSCTGPIVGNALIQSTSGGDYMKPIITMFVFSLTFALPFTLFAFFPTWLNNLPKSGGWLNSVKVVLGFIEVALGLKFLSVADQTYHWGILDREIYLAIWIVVFSLMGVYLLGKLKFSHDSDVKHIGVGRLFLVITTFSFVVYLVPGMFGAPLKGISGYLPPMHTQDFVIPTVNSGTNTGASSHSTSITVDNGAPKYSDFLHLPHGLSGFFDLDEAQQYADKVGKPLFIDITGHGCVNCREMEARVWSDPQVLNLLRNEYVVVALYLDDKKILPESDWTVTDNGKTLKGLGKINSYMVLKKYGVNAQPYYVLQGRGGRILTKPRGYDLSIPGFIDFLKSGIESYNAE